MRTLLILFGVAVLASVVLTAAAKRVAQRFGILDAPDGQRKLHRGPVPLWGGTAVYLSMVIALAAARFGEFGVGSQLDSLMKIVVIAAGLICLVGCIDDAYRLGSRTKLLFQLFAILPIIGAGYSVERITAFGLTLELGWFGNVVAIVWLLGCVNAINLLDGMDGLASIVGISTALTLGVIASYTGCPHATVVAVTMAGALVGFLVHNLPPARIFLGDSGSMVIGLVVGLLGMQSTIKTTAALSITAPLVVMTLPMFDTALALVRRKLSGRRFDSADRQHVHHRLLDRGMNPWLVLGILGTLCLATGVAATIGTFMHSDAVAWVTAAMLLILGIRLRLLGNYEVSLLVGKCSRALSTLARSLSHPKSRQHIPSVAELDAMSADRAWSLLIELTQCWSVHQLTMRVAAENTVREERRWNAPILRTVLKTPSENGNGVPRSDDGKATTGSAIGAKARSECDMVIKARLPDGRLCELRASLFDSASELVDLAGLAKVLSLFANRFASQDSPRPSRLTTRTIESGVPAGVVPEGASPGKHRHAA
jgi:UDP-GlcNAc:undecaprenyl-phosphate GlcNAc-1-phosphate transferase